MSRCAALDALIVFITGALEVAGGLRTKSPLLRRCTGLEEGSSQILVFQSISLLLNTSELMFHSLFWPLGCGVE
jgi:hypothetical protein